MQEKSILVCPKCTSTEIIKKQTNYLCKVCNKPFNTPKSMPLSKLEKLIITKPKKIEKEFSFQPNLSKKIISPIIIFIGILLLFLQPVLGLIILGIGLLILYFAYMNESMLEY